MRSDFFSRNLVSRWLSLVISSHFGLGFLKPAPGTWGSLGTIPILIWLQVYSLPFQLLFWVSYFFLAWIAVFGVFKSRGAGDHSWIVSDEVLGMGLTFLGAQCVFDFLWLQLVATFGLFRFFDILKFPPVRNLDSWSKKQHGWTGAFGVIADDIVASFQAYAVLFAIYCIQSFL